MRGGRYKIGFTVLQRVNCIFCSISRCLTCQQIPEDVYDRACLTISDRLRIPSCAGGGAVRVNPDVAIPVVCVTLLLLLATIHYVMTVICLTILPSVVLCQYRIWTRRKNKPRTQVSYLWFLSRVNSWSEILCPTSVTERGSMCLPWPSVRICYGGVCVHPYVCPSHFGFRAIIRERMQLSFWNLAGRLTVPRHRTDSILA